MAARTRVRTLPLAGMAAAGVVLGHWVAYRLALPAEPLRDRILTQTGHAYWFMAVKVAVIAALTGAGALFTRHLRAGREPARSAVDAYSGVVVRLAVLQTIAFTAVEALERVAAGAPVMGVFSHDLLFLGLAVQFLTACAGGIVVLLLSRTARYVASVLARSRLAPATAPAFVLPRTWGPVARLIGTPNAPRAPPRS